MKNFFFFLKLIYKNLPINFYLFIAIIKNSYQEECEKSTPIKLNDNNCYLKYCTKEEFDQGKCVIDNSIIKTQWLTNIINVGSKTFRFINFAISSKNELYLHTTAYPNSYYNCFFGIKSNGRPLLNFNGELLSVVCVKYDDLSIKARYNGELITLVVSDNNIEKEYLMSIGKDDNYVELFDFINKEIIFYSTTKRMTDYNIRSKYFALLDYVENNKHYYILSFIGKDLVNNNHYFVFQKYDFSYNSKNDEISHVKTEYLKIINLGENNYKFALSCYQTEKRLFVCFYYNSNQYYTAVIYDIKLNQQESFDMAQPSNNQHLFFKCIHLKKEIGIFYYFLGENVDNGKPKIDIVEFIKDSNENNYKRNYIFKSLTTKIDNIKDTVYYNSIIKLNDNKFGMIQLSNNNKIIYIITFNLYNNDKKIISRYYTINLFELYNLKVSNDISSILFNSFFISGFSFNSGEDENFYSSIIMFSYPNAQDFELNLINNLTLYNYSFSLKEIIDNKIVIDNNIFGLVIKGIKIQSFPKNDKNSEIISLFSIKNNKIIKENQIIDKNDEIEFYFSESEIKEESYILEYTSVVTEPDYDIYNSYCEIDSENGNIEEEKKEFKKSEYIGKTGYISFIIDQTLTKKCNNKNCFYCLENDKNKCILYKREIEEDTLDQKELSIIYNKLREIIDQKSYDGEKIVMNMKDVLVQLSSIDFQEDNINDENSTNVFLGECKDVLKEKYNLKDNEILLMLKLDLFKPNSSTPLVEYEIYNYNNSEKLNLEYCNDLKIDVYVPIQLDNTTIFLYNNLNSSGYNLFDSEDSFYTDICSLYTTINGTDITLTDRQKDYYNKSLLLCQEDGCTYDHYDSTIKKVKCECPVSKISVKDNNQNSENNLISTIVEIYNNKEKLSQIFSLSIKNMNFKVLKCFKLVFKLEYFKKNIGSILLTILIIFYLVLMILYFTLGNNIIKEIINNATLNNQFFFKKKSLFRLKSIKELKKKNSDLGEKKGKHEFKSKRVKNLAINLVKSLLKNKIVKNDKNDKNNEINDNAKSNQLLKFEKKTINKEEETFTRDKNKAFSSKSKPSILKINCPPPKLEKKQTLKAVKFNTLKKTKTIKFNDISVVKNFDKDNFDSEFKNIDSKNLKISIKEPKRSLFTNNTQLILNKKNSLINKRKSRDKNIKETKEDKDNTEKKLNFSINRSNLPRIDNLNDEEINQLDYGTAIIIDKRTFMQYYWSLLKKKQLILFTFYPSNDYNIRIIKMSFFIISFSLYITINGFFFSDATMHKVYESNGEYNFIYQIPQIIYSSIVSVVINKLLKYLSLSEKSILDLKKEKNKKLINDNCQKIEKCLKIKLLIYFILGFLLMLFCWYFISTFCAVYSNTQIILIKNSLISFSLSMIYPCGYALLPGIFRIPALRAKNQDQECIYNLSEKIELIA